MTILIIDDHAVFRRALADLLRLQDGIDVLAEAEDGPAGVELAAELEPDVVLMDYRMPGLNGAAATRALREVQPEAAVIGVSFDSRPEVLRAMQEAGACGFFRKGDDFSSLMTMIEEADSCQC